MKKRIKKNIIGVTTAERFERVKLMRHKYPYSVHKKDSELFLQELEISDDNKVYKDNVEVLELKDYECLFIVVDRGDKYYVFGDSPLHYTGEALEFHKNPVNFEEFESVVGEKLKF